MAQNSAIVTIQVNGHNLLPSQRQAIEDTIVEAIQPRVRRLLAEQVAATKGN